MTCCALSEMGEVCLQTKVKDAIKLIRCANHCKCTQSVQNSPAKYPFETVMKVGIH